VHSSSHKPQHSRYHPAPLSSRKLSSRSCRAKFHSRTPLGELLELPACRCGHARTGSGQELNTTASAVLSLRDMTVLARREDRLAGEYRSMQIRE